MSIDAAGKDSTLAALAALIEGDRWLNADACAVYLGLIVPDGKPNAGQPNRRGFLERVSCRQSFPAALVIGNEKKWKKSEVDRWAEDERRINRAAEPAKTLARCSKSSAI
ncbi:hypothetical protein LL965_04325 [Xanthomonas cassavae CFBP 4642]|uniref:Transcriptional regulator n=1 Tax=Xanthomonas cassavae CFBP 4642 TaxID=1219375 RepID=A0ABS8HAZ6_9XANT|nr:hypothetical protein [Xanthomonas cassavae]MCC4619340.1 hypothetical protein [Xanthomonas cassavae CFBP 4642]